jgi:hypothetical protein
MRAVAVLCVVASSVLAGCSQPSPAATPSALAVPDAHVDPGAAVGAISGLVVDDAIRPVAGATVEVRGTGRNLTTDANGGFKATDLKPGTYFLAAHARLFLPVQASAVVEAGKTTAVRIQLPQDASPQPYHDTLHFRGHIDFYASEASFAAQLLAPGTLQCTCAWNVTPNPNWKTIMFEATGSAQVPNPGTPATRSGAVYWEFIGNGGNGDIKSAYTDFPLSLRFENGSFQDPGTSFLARITGGVWPSGQMDYDLYVTLWYNQAAPKGWSLLKGDA